MELTPLGIDVYKLIKDLHDSKETDTSYSKQITESLHKKIGKTTLYQKYIDQKDLLETDEFVIANFLGVRAGMSRQIRYKFFNLLSLSKDRILKNM